MLDLSKEIDERNRATIVEVATAAEGLGISFIIVGAMARDLILHHVYGAPIKRGTNDIDFGIQISAWDEFNRLKETLFETGYSEDKQVQRLKDPGGRYVDIVPFGPLQDIDANVGFPPKGDFKMSVLGFQEALDNSINVVIQKDPVVTAPVVSPQGLALLKIIAWEDRAREKRGKDALDLAYLLGTYERVCGIGDRAYASEGLMESVDWDLTIACAYLLGQDTAAITKVTTRKKAGDILNKALDVDDPGNLIIEMCEFGRSDAGAKLALLAAFNRGFKGE